MLEPLNNPTIIHRIFHNAPVRKHCRDHYNLPSLYLNLSICKMGVVIKPIS